MNSDSTDLPDRPGGTAPHVLVGSIETPQLGSEDRHHLLRVRRLRDGDLVSVTDGRGAWRWTEFVGADLRVLSDVCFVERSEPLLTIGFALVKGSKPELVVQKLTEIGVDVIIPFVAERSVVRWDDAKADRQADRLAKVALEAASQSRRVWFPIVEQVATFSDLCSRGDFVRADRGGIALDRTHTSVLVGPEGGWSDDEASASPAVGLGENVLRAETASITAGALMVALRDGFLG